MALETLRTAWIGLMSHRLRTALTVLGITIGIASVIVLIAVGKGSSDAVQESIDELGSEHPDRERHGRGETSSGTPVDVTLEKADVEALEDTERAPAIKSVSPVVSASGTELVYGSATAEPGEFVGTTPSYFEAHNYTVERGRFFAAARSTNARGSR